MEKNLRFIIFIFIVQIAIILLSSCVEADTPNAKKNLQDQNLKGKDLNDKKEQKQINESKSFYYVAMGDSILIDKYAGNENCECGGASLFFKNKNLLFPSYKNKDLLSIIPNAKKIILAQDSAKIDDLFLQFTQLKQLKITPNLITVSIGGNDIVEILRSKSLLQSDKSHILNMLDEFSKKITAISMKLNELKKINNELIIMILNVYDPTDGLGYDFTSNKSNSFLDHKHKSQIYHIFYKFNEELMKISTINDYILIDIHSHFLGHGIFHNNRRNNPFYVNGKYWYHSNIIIDINQSGAHELRKLLYYEFQKNYIKQKTKSPEPKNNKPNNPNKTLYY